MKDRAIAFFDHIRACNNADLSRLRPFNAARTRLGWIGDDFAARLRDWPKVFSVVLAGGGVQGGHVPLEMIPALEADFPRHGVQGIAQPGLLAHRGETVYGDARQAATVAGQGRVQ